MRNCKIIIMFIVCLTIISSFSHVNVYAHTLEEVKPYYVVIFNTNETFDINNLGVASMTASLVPKKTKEINGVKVTFVIENSKGERIFNKTCKATWNSLFKEYNVENNYQLQNKGTYRFRATYKCYNGSVLVETITTDYILDVYK